MQNKHIFVQIYVPKKKDDHIGSNLTILDQNEVKMAIFGLGRTKKRKQRGQLLRLHCRQQDQAGKGQESRDAG